jgi:hypothetical protein
LYTWTAKGNAVTDRNGEGPKVIHWQRKYWLIADTWSGQGVWTSDDLTHWTPQEGMLIGNHGDVVISGGRAWWFYFGGQTGRGQNIHWAIDPRTAATAPATLPARGSRAEKAINVVELHVVDGRLVYEDPSHPTHIALRGQREEER